MRLINRESIIINIYNSSFNYVSFEYIKGKSEFVMSLIEKITVVTLLIIFGLEHVNIHIRCL